ncbi:MAG TPA: MopE-related protein, partial [Phnomibacter sp.]|nr:MopE-related protein [Phnomibacter sp.]
GGEPTYQWLLNDAQVGTNNASYSNNSLQDGDKVQVIMTSSLGCASPENAASNEITITVTPSVTPSVSIGTTAENICAGTSVTFTATPVNGGNTPFYQWKVNNTNAGTNSSSFTTTQLQDGDVVTVTMTSNAACASPNSVTSNGIAISVAGSVTPAVSIQASGTNICAGEEVVFTATPTNQGDNPVYAWTVNGEPVGDNNPTYSTSTLQNGQTVQVSLTSSIGCAVPPTVSSNSISVIVNAIVTPAVNITPSVNNVCQGTSITFTAIATNGGDNPSFQWKVNGGNVGTNSSSFTTTQLLNEDVVMVVLTSSQNCLTQTMATSNEVVMQIIAPVTPSVSIAASAEEICNGTSVTFTATLVNGGTPSYQWKRNGEDVGEDSDTYTADDLEDGDEIGVVMTTSLPCITGPTATSNTISMTVHPIVVPSVSISASATTICVGTQVTFTATPVNGGSSPIYQWKLNGEDVGANLPVFTSSTLQHEDEVQVVMTSNAACVSTATVSSNTVTILVGSQVVPVVSIDAPKVDICAGESLTFTATPQLGGEEPTYKWLVNGNDAPGNNSGVTYTAMSLQNGDKVSVVMTSSLLCAEPKTATSNELTITVIPLVTPSVSIQASETSICAGTAVTFTATPTNGGTPSYQWKRNGEDVGDNSDTYTASDLANGDVIEVEMTSTAVCVSQATAASNQVTMTVATPVVYYLDNDGDGFGNNNVTQTACVAPVGYVLQGGDCDDTDNTVYPGAPELCDGKDNNCNGTVDEGCGIITISGLDL